ncbi:hypothetical protein NM208_g4950 [Fusarium decemcellulare]|uniref:Uncharacterized protein n=1 Tax=Fusarium decemcellulare TaxID=57161 RepID=A0ACC1SIT1_9HYPO|nr:hypothetical protein NM208_g4950 [Fusarium decemcellulare]
MAKNILRSSALSALLMPTVLAQSNSTNLNGTGNAMVGWISPEARRSTWGIIWSCLSIFIVCSWNCVHLNLPTHRESRGEWHKFNIFNVAAEVPYWPKSPLRRKWIRKLSWMGFIAIVPEFGVGLATRQYLDARKDLNLVQTESSHRHFTMVHAFYAQMGGIAIYEIPVDDPAPQAPLVTLITSLEELENSGAVPDIPEQDIRDQSQADALAKAFALIQCTWLVIQSIARRSQGYAISQLELATLAFIPCALAMHIFWWNKPFGVERRRALGKPLASQKVLASVIPYSMDEIMAPNPQILDKRQSDLADGGFCDLLTDFLPGDEKSISNRLPSVAFYITAIISSAIYLVAWSWDFPSLLNAAISFIISFIIYLRAVFKVCVSCNNAHQALVEQRPLCVKTGAEISLSAAMISSTVTHGTMAAAIIQGSLYLPRLGVNQDILVGCGHEKCGWIKTGY